MVVDKDPDNFVLGVDFKKICATPWQKSEIEIAK
jgi:hypothetical protein